MVRIGLSSDDEYVSGPVGNHFLQIMYVDPLPPLDRFDSDETTATGVVVPVPKRPARMRNSDDSGESLD